MSPGGGIAFRCWTSALRRFQNHESITESHQSRPAENVRGRATRWLQTQRSRRNILKGGLVGAGALVAAPVLGTASAGASTRPKARNVARRAPSPLLTRDRLPGSSVAPFGRHISYGADPTRQMNISWQVNAPVTNRSCGSADRLTNSTSGSTPTSCPSRRRSWT